IVAANEATSQRPRVDAPPTSWENRGLRARNSGNHPMFDVDGHHLTLEDLVRVARERAPFRVPDESMRRVAASRTFLERCVAEGQTIYGVNTGIGHLVRVRIPAAGLDDLQRNIVLSHAAGTGPDLDDDEVRGILLLKINLFAKGLSGVR